MGGLMVCRAVLEIRRRTWRRKRRRVMTGRVAMRGEEVGILSACRGRSRGARGWWAQTTARQLEGGGFGKV